MVSFFEYNLSKLPNSYKFKKDYLDKNASTIQVLVLGSSHGLYGINPQFLSLKTFNAADTSQSLYYDYQIFKKYINSFKNLKKVIISVSYFSLEYNFSASVEAWREFFYKRIYEIKTESGQDNLDIRNFSYLALYGQIRSISYALKLFNVNLAENISADGWYNIGPIRDPNARSALQINIFREASMEAENYSKNVGYLKDMIKLAKENGIEPIIITTPVYSDYSDKIDKEKYNLMQNTIKGLAEEYKIKYFNHFYDKSFAYELFFDDEHLNSKGAEKFTKILDKELSN